MNRFYVLAGSNIRPVENMQKGLDFLRRYDSIVVEAVSSIYKTKAVGFESDDFLNQAIRCSTEKPFKLTVAVLKSIEDKCGRKRTLGNAFTPRSLDLDIVMWNDFKGVLEGYCLPDPDIEKYDYIKKPLAEVLIGSVM